MEFAPEEYTRHYLVEALFRLMGEYEFEKITVKDIAEKAGVGRATFYRYFRRKEDVIVYYFEHNTKNFLFRRRYFPRCREDYIDIATSALSLFKENAERFLLIRKARLEYLYLDFLNREMCETFEKEYGTERPYALYLYAGMLFNVSMAWLCSGCLESVETVAEMIVDSIYFEKSDAK